MHMHVEFAIVDEFNAIEIAERYNFPKISELHEEDTEY